MSWITALKNNPGSLTTPCPPPSPQIYFPQPNETKLLPLPFVGIPSCYQNIFLLDAWFHSLRGILTSSFPAPYSLLKTYSFFIPHIIASSGYLQLILAYYLKLNHPQNHHKPLHTLHTHINTNTPKQPSTTISCHPNLQHASPTLPSNISHLTMPTFFVIICTYTNTINTTTIIHNTHHLCILLVIIW